MKREGNTSEFNPEEFTTLKREWTHRHLQNSEGPIQSLDSGTKLFEHFVIAGAAPNSLDDGALISELLNCINGSGDDKLDVLADTDHEGGLDGPTLPSEILYSYPDGLSEDLQTSIAAFCHPHGVRPELLKRISEHSDSSEGFTDTFIFLMKVADGDHPSPRPLYGICGHVTSPVRCCPMPSQEKMEDCNVSSSEYIVSVPRCYCILSYYPFFRLHYQVLRKIIELDRPNILSMVQGSPQSMELMMDSAVIYDDILISEARKDHARKARGEQDEEHTELQSHLVEVSNIAKAPGRKKHSLAITNTQPTKLEAMLAQYSEIGVPYPGQEPIVDGTLLSDITFKRTNVIDDLQQLGLNATEDTVPDIEAAANLRVAAIATLCHAMSLENILAYLTAILLEKQIVVFCPNIYTLSNAVLAIMPLMLPFRWHSMLLPVLPTQNLQLLEAPVPFIVGVQHETPQVRAKCENLVQINICKDRFKNIPQDVQLPQYQALYDALLGPYQELRNLGTPSSCFRIAQVEESKYDRQQILTESFAATFQKYLLGLVSDLKGYMITDVSGQDRVSVLMMESFVDSFPPRDRPLMRQFVQTQTFSVYCDSV